MSSAFLRSSTIAAHTKLPKSAVRFTQNKIHLLQVPTLLEFPFDFLLSAAIMAEYTKLEMAACSNCLRCGPEERLRRSMETASVFDFLNLREERCTSVFFTRNADEKHRYQKLLSAVRSSVRKTRHGQDVSNIL